MKSLRTILLLFVFLLPFVAQAQQKKDSPFALTTNFLSWATLAPNLGGEVYIGKSCSVAVDGSFGMWGYSHTQRATQTWSVGGEARYWLQTGGSGFRRTHIGVSVRGGSFDSNFFTDGGRQGEALLAGVTMGYRFALRGNWFVDAGLGLGYIHARYDRYIWNKRFGKYEFRSERTRDLFGLTDLHVSLVYRIPSKNR